jgi:hypothetical protein
MPAKIQTKQDTRITTATASLVPVNLKIKFVWSEVFTTVTTKSTLFWDVMPCSFGKHKIWGTHSCTAVDSSLLQHYIALMDEQYLTFWRNAAPSSSVEASGTTHLTQHHIPGDFSLLVGTNLPPFRSLLQWRWSQQISPKKNCKFLPDCTVSYAKRWHSRRNVSCQVTLEVLMAVTWVSYHFRAMQIYPDDASRRLLWEHW